MDYLRDKDLLKNDNGSMLEHSDYNIKRQKNGQRISREIFNKRISNTSA